MSAELFELEMFGEGIERRYRAMRPEVERMPWGTLDLRGIDEADLVTARRAWTGAAYQEHRTGVACCATLRALMECRAPVDLVALATRFPLDEMVHVELCARMAMELGGGTEIVHDPDAMVLDASPGLRPIARAAELVTRFFCVGEALSIPLLRGTWKAARHPLPKAVLGAIVRDEAAHGTFGFAFLDWALPRLTPEEVAHVGRHADLGVRTVKRQWEALRRRPPRTREVPADALAWMETDAYLGLAERSMVRCVVRPLRARGVTVTAWPETA